VKKWLLGVPAAAIVAFAVAQGSGTQYIQSFVKALSSADSIVAEYTYQPLNGARTNYSVAFAKPNKLRIDSDFQLIVADGTKVTYYDKKAKTYYSDEQSNASIAQLLSDDKVGIWAPFFGKNIETGATKVLGVRKSRGVTLTGVEAQMPGGAKTVTFYFSEDGLARQAEFAFKNGANVERYLFDSKSIQIGAATEALFAFRAPQDARELSAEERMSDKWFTNLEEAKKAAKASNRLIFTDFFATWCGPCKALEAEVFTTDRFKALSKKFVFLKIDVDLQPDVMKAYGVTAMPTQMILNADGGVLKKTVGYGGPEAFYSFIEGVE